MIRTDFWQDPIVSEEMSVEDKYFYLYLLTNQNTTQIGIYKITKKQMAFDLGYSIETVHSLMDRFIRHHKLIRYNPETREIAIKNWGLYNLNKGGKPVMDCIDAELKEVQDRSLIPYVAESIHKQEICSRFETFCEQEEMCFDHDMGDQDENDTYLDPECDEMEDMFHTTGGQKEKQQQQAASPNTENRPDIVNHQKVKDVKEIIECWDDNGFGFTNINAKQQLLTWLDDSSFLHPKDVIIKAMNIACSNNKRRLSYIIGILKNWENESLLTVEEIDSYQENQKPIPKHRESTNSYPTGRQIPSGFEINLTAGEE
ncbi:DNA replication protein DnaD [Neobacillus cucumis]|uniref:DNA replication protein DnaD n=1 Tax=Neobacillus cucumis TaxID=1740721 RepID=A0A2N5H8Y4_9BACI|nr:DNA replication protein DnaD [Neobacillus cucumis]